MRVQRALVVAALFWAVGGCGEEPTPLSVEPLGAAVWTVRYDEATFSSPQAVDLNGDGDALDGHPAPEARIGVLHAEAPDGTVTTSTTTNTDGLFVADTNGSTNSVQHPDGSFETTETVTDEGWFTDVTTITSTEFDAVTGETNVTTTTLENGSVTAVERETVPAVPSS